MLRGSFVFASLLGLALAGCSGDGGGGCSEAVTYVSRPAYAGPYTATFTPTGGSLADSLTFSLQVSTHGVVTGTEGQSNSLTDVAGAAGDIKSNCAIDGTGLALQFTMDGESRTLTVAKTLNGDLAGNYVGALARNGGEVTGSMVVSSAAVN